MRSSHLLLLIVCLFCSVLVRAQDKFWNSPDAYLDQPLPGDVPQRFAPPHLTDSGYFVLGRVAFSADGKEFYYGVNDAWFSNAHQTLRCFRFENGEWKGPILLGAQYSQPTFSPDGKTLYVSNDGILQMHRTSTGWTKPAPYLKRSYALYNFMPAQSGHSYVGSNGTWGLRSDYSSWQFAVLPADINDTSIKSLGQPLNAPGFNGDFYIAPDESYMIISAKETKDFECELWISFRKPDETWTAPKSLGPAINEGVAHRFGQYVTPDGKFLFYTKGTSEKDCALYWVRFDRLLKKLKQESL
jgi:hypothetical protein